MHCDTSFPPFSYPSRAGARPASAPGCGIRAAPPSATHLAAARRPSATATARRRRANPLAIVLTTASALCWFGCSSTPKPSEAKVPVRAYTYRVGAGDILSITVWKEPELQPEPIPVQPDGSISFPLAGTVAAAGRSLPEVAESVRAQLAKHLTAPLVSVRLIESRSAQIHVLGEVPVQTPLIYRERMSVVEAISRAGGPLWVYAKTESVHVVRGALSRPQLIAVDLDDVLDGSGKDMFLEPGDIVVVPAKWVTRFDRYVTQLLAPLRLGASTGASVASAGVTAGTTTLVSPFP